MEKEKTSVRLGTFVLLIILVAVAFGGAGYLYGKNASSTKAIVATATTTATSIKTPPSTASQAVALSGTATNARSVTSEDLSAIGKDLEGAPLAKIVADSLTYNDLNGDGAEEAIFVSSSGGTAGAEGVYVYGFKDESLVQLLKDTGKTHYKYEISGKVLNVSAIDPNSSVNKDKPNSDMSYDVEKDYTWDGSKFVQK